MKSSLRLKDVMTPCPVSIAASGSLEEARRLMTLHGLRHLPVLEQGEVIGLISQRDLEMSERLCNISGSCPVNVQAMEPKDPLVVDEDMLLVELAESLTINKADCVLAANGEGQFTGIFTTSDAFRVLYLLLSEEQASGNSD